MQLRQNVTAPSISKMTAPKIIHPSPSDHLSSIQSNQYGIQVPFPPLTLLSSKWTVSIPLLIPWSLKWSSPAHHTRQLDDNHLLALHYLLLFHLTSLARGLASFHTEFQISVSLLEVIDTVLGSHPEREFQGTPGRSDLDSEFVTDFCVYNGFELISWISVYIQALRKFSSESQTSVLAPLLTMSWTRASDPNTAKDWRSLALTLAAGYIYVSIEVGRSFSFPQMMMIIKKYSPL